LFEAGETGKFSNRVSLAGLKGVLNVMSEMAMWPAHEQERPPFQVIVKSSDWIRAQKGGILDLQVRPGDLVYSGDVIGTILNPFGRTVTRMVSSVTGIAIGVTSAPITVPGTAIVHVAKLKKALSLVERSLQKKRAKPRRKRTQAGLRKKNG
jgi:predicted deacylase